MVIALVEKAIVIMDGGVKVVAMIGLGHGGNNKIGSCIKLICNDKAYSHIKRYVM